MKVLAHRPSIFVAALPEMAMVHNKREVIDLLGRHGMEITRFGVERLGLFGSFARDEARENSDVDLLVEFHPGQKSLRNLVGLSAFLKGILGRNVELVTPASLDRYIGKYILKEVEYVPFAA